MINENCPIKHRILVEKIHADGHREIVGDSGFKPIYNKDKLILLLNLMQIDLDKKKKIMELLNNDNIDNI